MRLRFFVVSVALVAAFLVASGRAASAAGVVEVGDYEGRPVGEVKVVFEGSPSDANAEAEFVSLIVVKPGDDYSAVRVRDSLQALMDAGCPTACQVASVRVEVRETGCPVPAGGIITGQKPVCLRFIVRRQVRVGEVVLDLGVTTGTPVSEDELRSRLNMLDPGSRVSQQMLSRNADEIQGYLRDRGFFRAEVDFKQVLDASGTRATVFFTVKLNEQARVAAFNINIKGFDPAPLRPSLKLLPNAAFTRGALAEDITRIRQSIIAQGYLSPQIDEKVTFDTQTNRITINVTGGVGPKVNVTTVGYELKEKKARELFPVMREGSIDQSAIVEGARRLRNRLQEDGYFFAEVTPVCTVIPALPTLSSNGTSETCESLNPEELTNRTVNIRYEVERGRRFKLTEIRIEGTDKLTIEDLTDDLKTKEANALGFIPLLGYGRGYTSRELLDQDARRIRARMQDLGYRRANVTVRQGVALNGDNLIITFVVTEGALTRVAGVEIRGNQIYTVDRLRRELEGTVIGAPFSRSASRLDGDRILGLYARDGYIDAQVDFSIVELPRKTVAGDVQEEQVKVVYTIKAEGDKVFINRILVNGNVLTKREAILNAIPLVEGEVLRLDKLTESERILYETDAFRQVIIRTEMAGETASGFKKRDVIIEVEELKPRIREFGGGYSTDNGPLGFFSISNVNLFGKLRQGTVRLRFSARQQLVRLEYYDPRFQRYGEGQFAPLALSVQYQRDSTLTRFFRTTIDRGNFGIVQRLDADGNPINQFGDRTGEPTINRLTFNAETQRMIDRDSRSILFLRYNYEDVRLYKIGSLLLAPLLEPDRAVRISRIAATFVRDTRLKCTGNASPGTQTVLQGTRQQPCQYSQSDATDGDFLTLDYGLALRQLGGNLSFNKFQGNYRRYYRVDRARGTVLAGSITLGLANIFNARDRNGNNVIDDVDLTLPISERFFSGGSTTLRGFGYEEAGPREAIIPEGVFRNQDGDPIRLNPFLVPTGGNAMAVVQLEARVPISKLLQVVPFYDGGNVFRNVSDLFGRRRSEDNSSLPYLEQIRRANLRVNWTSTVGLGLRIRTPLGGALAVDYGFLLDPPAFLLPQSNGETAVIRIRSSQIHFRFTQAF